MFKGIVQSSTSKLYNARKAADFNFAAATESRLRFLTPMRLPSSGISVRKTHQDPITLYKDAIIHQQFLDYYLDFNFDDMALIAAWTSPG